MQDSPSFNPLLEQIKALQKKNEDLEQHIDNLVNGVDIDEDIVINKRRITRESYVEYDYPEIEFGNPVKVEGEWTFKNPFVLNWISDKHDGAITFAKKAWARYKSMKVRSLEINPHQVFILGGDESDDARYTEDRDDQQKSAGTKRKITIGAENQVNRQVEDFAFLKGKLIGSLPGNHDRTLDYGSWASKIMCEKLGGGILVGCVD